MRADRLVSLVLLLRQRGRLSATTLARERTPRVGLHRRTLAEELRAQPRIGPGAWVETIAEYEPGVLPPRAAAVPPLPARFRSSRSFHLGAVVAQHLGRADRT